MIKDCIKLTEKELFEKSDQALNELLMDLNRGELQKMMEISVEAFLHKLAHILFEREDK